MPHTNNHKPTTYTEAFKRVEAIAENAMKERLNRSMRLLCETETMRDPVERELAQARTLENIAKTNTTLEKHQTHARFSKGS